jgi:hypothetical protein
MPVADQRLTLWQLLHKYYLSPFDSHTSRGRILPPGPALALYPGGQKHLASTPLHHAEAASEIHRL